MGDVNGIRQLLAREQNMSTTVRGTTLMYSRRTLAIQALSPSRSTETFTWAQPSSTTFPAQNPLAFTGRPTRGQAKLFGRFAYLNQRNRVSWLPAIWFSLARGTGNLMLSTQRRARCC